jgi:hypothetical protein
MSAPYTNDRWKIIHNNLTVHYHLV